MEYPNLHHQQHHELQEDYGGQVQHIFSNILSHDYNPAIPINNTTNNSMYQTKYIPELIDYRSNYPDFGRADTRNNSAARNGGIASSFDMSHVLPSTGSVATWDVSSPQLFSSSFGLTLPTLDLLASTNYSGISSISSSHDKYHQLRDCISSKLEQMQASNNKDQGTMLTEDRRQLNPVFNNGSSTRKRAINISVPKEPHAETKKQRTSCTPTKVRERVATLQRLVAPFGKTDQATVLTKAIGYIQFLQDRIQTLSVPYMKSSNGNTSRIMGQGISNKDRRDATQRDLKSRGLCLVPLSLASYLNNYD